LPAGSLPRIQHAALYCKEAEKESFQGWENAVENENWTTHPEATQLLQLGLQKLLDKSPWLRHFSDRLASETGTRLFDWVDRITIDCDAAHLHSLGFEEYSPPGEPVVFRHSKALLPFVALRESNARDLLSIKVDSVIDFANSHQLDDRTRLVGQPLAHVRRLLASSTNEVEIWVVERHGSWGWESSEATAGWGRDVVRLAENFRLRPRSFGSIEEGFRELKRVVSEAVGIVGVARAADMFFSAERQYWQARNRAAQLQKMRQDRLGLGWANHDHHTYRSGRPAFHHLTRVLEKLGMHCRERFYAGREAGWGAQVLEQPEAGVVVFADVDLAPDEVVRDFAHQPLQQRDSLGTVGLWCALHGEAILEAGMHHLECQFEFDAARDQLTESGVGSMKPFTDFPFLRQCFTVGERWPVREANIQRTLAAGWITPDQAQQFRDQGAIGSHLEILERNGGYKGFNQTGISEIILDTDPRRQPV
jgi:hypothetical protein